MWPQVAISVDGDPDMADSVDPGYPFMVTIAPRPDPACRAVEDAALHAREGVAVDDVPGFGRERHVRRHDVGGVEQLVQRHVAGAQLVRESLVLAASCASGPQPKPAMMRSIAEPMRPVPTMPTVLPCRSTRTSPSSETLAYVASPPARTTAHVLGCGIRACS